jgi:hypothetical protein
VLHGYHRRDKYTAEKCEDNPFDDRFEQEWCIVASDEAGDPAQTIGIRWRIE